MSTGIFTTPAVKGNLTAWTSFVPTGSWSTNTTYAGQWRQVGDSVDYDILISLAGAPTAATLTVNLIHTVDTAKLNSSTAAVVHFGTAKFVDTGVKEYVGIVRYNSTTSVDLRVLAGDTANPPFTAVVNATSPITWGNTDTIHMRFSFPAVGLSF